MHVDFTQVRLRGAIMQLTPSYKNAEQARV